MDGPLQRGSLWSDLPCNSGTPIANIPFVTLKVTTRIENYVVRNLLEATVSNTWDYASSLICRNVIQLQDTVGNVPEEFRIVSVTGGFPAGTIQIRAQGVVFDLGEASTLITSTVSPAVKVTWLPDPGTVSTLATAAIAFAPAYFSVGTISLGGGVISISYDADTVLSALVKLIAADTLNYGFVPYEISVRNRGGTLGYYVDMTQTGSSALVPVLRPSKNLQSYAYLSETDQFVDRCYPTGIGGSGLGDAQFNVSAVVLNTSITVGDIDIPISYIPCIEPNSLQNLYWIHEDGVAHQITASTIAGVLSMASTTGIAVGEWGRLAINSAGDYLTYLDYPSRQAVYGVKLAVLPTQNPGHTNWLKNGDLADWAGATTTISWTTALNQFTKTTTSGLWQTGGASAYTGAAANVVSLLQDRTVYCPLNATVTYFWRVFFTRITTVVTSDHVDIGNPNTGTNDQWNFESTSSLATSLQVETGTWLEFTKSYSVTAAGNKALHFGFWRDGTVVGGGGLYYVDCAQVTVTPQGVNPPQGFVRHSGSAKVYGAGITKLRANFGPPTTVEVGVQDLYRLDGTTWPFDQLSLGVYANLTEYVTPSGGIQSLRIMEIQRNILNPLDTKVTLTARKPQFSGLA